MKKIALLFPGQGSQYIGMGKNLCEKFPIARQTFEEAKDALGFDIQKLCFEGTIDELTKTENTQPALLTSSVAAFRVYMEEISIEPQYLSGHSLGEFSALCCAGAINFSDAVKLVRQRGKYMQEAVPVGLGSMAAISGVSKSIIEEECTSISSESKIVVVSNYNSLDQIVISGHTEAVQVVSENLKKLGARAIPLKVSAPFHSPLMQAAADNLKTELGKYSFYDFKYPVLANITAKPYPGKDNIIVYLARQIVEPVRWQEQMEFLERNGIEAAIEIGPQKVLRNLMKKNTPTIKAFSYDEELDILALKRLISPGGGELYKNGISIITKCIAAAVTTKNKNFDNEQYQRGVVEPYRKITAMKDLILQERREPSKDEIEICKELLNQILTCKGIPENEKHVRLENIFF